MKENPNIEELLNGFLDGELTQRQQTEVQRLIAHDAQIARRLAELEKCKVLVGSLPCAEAPDEMLEEIKTSLERRILLGQHSGRFDEPRPYQGRDEREGARHLLFRKVLTAAAMIGLVAVLGAVIYSIVAPERVTKKPIAIESWQQPTREVEVKVEKPRTSVVATVEKPVGQTDQAVTEFNGRLELKTSNPIAIASFIDKTIKDNDLLDCISQRDQGNKSLYTLSCNREALSLLLADLKNVWARFDSATLFVETDRVGEQVVVDGVGPEQIVEIVNQDNLEKRIKVAKDFAVLNDMAELLPGEEVLAVIDDKSGDLITIPKPALTSGERTVKEPPSRAERKVQVHLTIVVEGGK